MITSQPQGEINSAAVTRRRPSFGSDRGARTAIPLRPFESGATPSGPRDVQQAAESELILPQAPRLPASRHGSAAKRGFDIAFALIMIAVFAPLLLLLIAAVAISSPGPVIFRQRRIGKGGKIFLCLKLRSMVIDAEARLEALLAADGNARAEWASDQKLRHDPRITPIGRFLRRSSLDELPQLWNILVGEMSVVGPRPIVEAEAIRYGEFLSDYCKVRPGLTGPWQIGGRNDVSYDERVQLDVGYVRSRTFAADLAICFKTVPAMLASRGCY